MSRTLGAFPLPTYLPADAFDNVNRRVAEATSHRPEVWYAFASAWNGMVYRARAADEHAASFVASLSVSTAPVIEVRFRQDHDLFAFATCAVSAVECFHFAALCLGAVRARGDFRISAQPDLTVRLPDLRDRFVRCFPSESLTKEIETCLSDRTGNELRGLRNVLSHRGTPPRRHYLGTSDPDRKSRMPSNLVELASRWRYDLELNNECLRDYQRWYRDSLAALVTAAALFASKL